MDIQSHVRKRKRSKDISRIDNISSNSSLSSQVKNLCMNFDEKSVIYDHHQYKKQKKKNYQRLFCLLPCQCIIITAMIIGVLVIALIFGIMFIISNCKVKRLYM
mgnify:FL=1